jgi:hypothetical protein
MVAPASVEAYMAACPEDARAALEHLRAMIKAAAPDGMLDSSLTLVLDGLDAVIRGAHAPAHIHERLDHVVVPDNLVFEYRSLQVQLYPPRPFLATAEGRGVKPARRDIDPSSDGRRAGLLLVSRAAATPTLRASRSTLRAAGIISVRIFRRCRRNSREHRRVGFDHRMKRAGRGREESHDWKVSADD